MPFSVHMEDGILVTLSLIFCDSHKNGDIPIANLHGGFLFGDNGDWTTLTNPVSTDAKGPIILSCLTNHSI